MLLLDKEVHALLILGLARKPDHTHPNVSATIKNQSGTPTLKGFHNSSIYNKLFVAWC